MLTRQRLIFAFALACCSASACGSSSGSVAQEPIAPPQHLTQTVLVRVVDGDTFHVKRGDKLEKLRLLGVDTEEVRDNGPGSKPATELGRAASAHMKELLRCDKNGQPLPDVKPAVIELEFENGIEERDTYGRLLCYTWFESQNLNIHLVETGFSPYFTKYGYSGAHHAQFVSAQQRAQVEKKGIWGERSAADGARDYAVMLRWWNARADALRAAQERLASGQWIDVRQAEALQRAAAEDKPANLFGAAMGLRVTRDRIEIELEATTAMSCTIVCLASDFDPAFLAQLVAHVREGAPNYLDATGQVIVKDKAARLECESLRSIHLHPPAGN